MKKRIKTFILNFTICLFVVGSIGFVGARILIDSNDVTYKNTTVKETLNNILKDIDSLESRDTSNATPPIIKENLIPIKLDNSGNVTMVAENDPTWYNYDKKIWANAVELVSGAKYHKGEADERQYQIGDNIPESDIRSYFVWIPKFKYRLWNVGTTNPTKLAHSIEIIFDTTNTTNVNGESCEAPMASHASGECENGEWMTHPAFISMGVDGFWVGKFEIGHSSNNAANTKNSLTAATLSNVVVKPDYYSWTSTKASDYFKILLNYNESLNSHMIKNTEWGAVAILAHSKYGICKEIRINNQANNDTYWYIKTGHSASLTTNQSSYPNTINDSVLYNTPIGYLASTTGNITGVYDMSGGANEYVAAFRTGNNEITAYDSKYYDVYGAATSQQDYEYRILGDATGEMGPFFYYKDHDANARYHNAWYSDISNFVISTLPWFGRGDDPSRGLLAGSFQFYGYKDVASNVYGSRLVLSPTKEDS